MATKKTLGRVAYEAAISAGHEHHGPWRGLTADYQTVWEASAQAVKRAVLREAKSNVKSEKVTNKGIYK